LEKRDQGLLNKRNIEKGGAKVASFQSSRGDSIS